MHSSISHKDIPKGQAILISDIRPGIIELIRKDYPAVSDFISLAELNTYRRLYLTGMLNQEQGELAQVDQDVMEAIRDYAILSEKIQMEPAAKLTFGARVADRVAAFGGSWTFIITFFVFILIWMLVNIWVLANRAFDPYPFILLNLLLSCIASIQAPIIMMSQNRQEEKDRFRNEQDYKINLKAELEIKLLSEKIDHLLVHQSNRLLEIQAVQMEYLEEIMKTVQDRKV